MQPPDREDGGSALARELFHDYVEEREAGRRPDLDALVHKAGAESESLLSFVENYESIRSLADELAAAGEERTAVPQGDAPVRGRLGRYELLDVLGSGGLARVHLARDTRLGRTVALKVLRREAGLARGERTSMLKEARSLAQLKHPGVVQVFEAEELDGHLTIAMERVEGCSLLELLDELRLRRGLAPRAATERASAGSALARLADDTEGFRARVALVAKIAEAVAYCHDRGVLHRDLKPSNVLLDEAGNPVLIDFGLAHLAEPVDDTTSQITELFFGTAEYLAPEQVEHERTGVNPGSDQFSLGVVLYELLTLESPFRRERRSWTMDAVAQAAPRPPRRFDRSIPLDLELVCLRTLERRPEDRYPSVGALAQDLHAFLADRPTSVSSFALGSIAKLWWRRRKRTLIPAVSLVGIVVLAWTWQWINLARGERADVLSGLASGQEVLAPEQFVARAQLLLGLQDRARDFDRSALKRVVFGSLEEPVIRDIDSWCRQLRAALDAGRPEPGFTYDDWRMPLEWESILAPESEHNRADQERGTFELVGADPSEVKLFAHHLLGAKKPTLREIPFRYDLPPGRYRITRFTGSPPTPLMTAEFAIMSRWDDKQRIELRRPSVELLERAVLVPEEAVNGWMYVNTDGLEALLNLAPAQEVVAVDPETVTSELREAEGIDSSMSVHFKVVFPTEDVPAFKALPEVVKWGDMLPYLEERGLRDLIADVEYYGSDAPANVAWLVALDFARSQGARLPSSLELDSAWKQELLTSEGVEHEWLSDAPYSTPDNAAFYNYIKFAEKVNAPGWIKTGDSLAKYATNPGTAFRLVVPHAGS